MTMNEKIQSLRRERGMSQEDLAITLGVSRQAVSKWEIGDAMPETDKIVALAEYFDVTTDWLLRDIQPQESASPKRVWTLDAFAPMMQCIYWCGTALGLVLLLHGRFVSSGQWPTLVGLMLQILFSLLSVGYGMMLEREQTGKGQDFLRRFWRVNVWLTALLPFSLLARLMLALLPEPLWGWGYSILPGGLRGSAHMLLSLFPPFCYVLFCVVVTVLLRRKSRQ